MLRVPTSKLDDEWTKAIKSVSSPSPFSFPKSLNTDRDILVVLRECEWLLVIHYVYKLKWDSKHKVPFRQEPQAQKTFRLEANWIYRILELCIQCHAVLPEAINPYPNAAKWFDHIVWEMKNTQYSNFPTEGEPGRECFDEQKQILSYLRKFENPFEPKCYPHYHRLIDAAIKQAKSQDVFRGSFWKDYLDDYKAFVDYTRTNQAYKTVFLKEIENKETGEKVKRAYYRPGGRGTAAFPLTSLKHIQDLLKKGSPKTLLP